MRIPLLAMPQGMILARLESKQECAGFLLTRSPQNNVLRVFDWSREGLSQAICAMSDLGSGRGVAHVKSWDYSNTPAEESNGYYAGDDVWQFVLDKVNAASGSVLGTA